MVRIIGYTADADYWCPDHAQEVYGEDTPERKDREGNDVHPIFSTDDYDLRYPEICRSCFWEWHTNSPVGSAPTLRD